MADEDGVARVQVEAAGLCAEIARLEGAASRLDRAQERAAKRPSLVTPGDRVASTARRRVEGAISAAGSCLSSVGGAALARVGAAGAGLFAVNELVNLVVQRIQGATLEKNRREQAQDAPPHGAGDRPDSADHRRGDDRLLRRMDERFAVERYRANLQARLENDPTFRRAAARVASREFERSATRVRQLRDAEESVSRPKG